MTSVDNVGRARCPDRRAISYLLLAAQLLSLVHILMAHHRLCPEDGDVIHAVESHATLAELVCNEVLSSTQPVMRSAPQAEHGHDHCLTCTSTNERFALLPPTQKGAAATRLFTPLDPASASALDAPVAVIVFAPKNSPPAV